MPIPIRKTTRTTVRRKATNNYQNWDAEKNDSIPWTLVNSSWIKRLRFVGVKRLSGRQDDVYGYIDMQTHGRATIYRYGTRSLIGRSAFKVWRVAASKGKHWWRQVTWRYSPADKM